MRTVLFSFVINIVSLKPPRKHQNNKRNGVCLFDYNCVNIDNDEILKILFSSFFLPFRMESCLIIVVRMVNKKISKHKKNWFPKEDESEEEKQKKKHPIS